MNRDWLDKMEGFIIQVERNGRYEDWSPFPHPSKKSALAAKNKLAADYPNNKTWRVVKRVITVTDTVIQE